MNKLLNRENPDAEASTWRHFFRVTREEGMKETKLKAEETAQWEAHLAS